MQAPSRIAPLPPITPQQGFQIDALSTEADIAIIGGAAGAGKSFVLLMESARHKDVPDFGGIIFRRTSPQIKNKGGLLDASRKIFTRLGGRLREMLLEWVFPGGQTIKFSHIQYEKDLEDYQGSEYAFIGFDELCHFTELQFWYMLSRNRSTCGVDPYVRASCNPDADSWVANLIEWYIDQETGYPIPERCGVLRYFIRIGDEMVWGNSKQEVFELVKNSTVFMEVMEKSAAAGVQWNSLIKSFTFIPGSIYENAMLLKADPAYLGNLMGLGENEQNQLLRGNWKVSQDGLALFEYVAVKNIFDNYATPSQFRCITCDASRFGRDLTVIMVWVGWTVVKIVIQRQSEPHDIVKAIEQERRTWGIIKSNVLVDQDGVGGSTVKIGGYSGFSGGAAAMVDRDAKVKENYKNLKNQCVYRCATDNVNIGEIRIDVTDSNCVIDGVFTTKLKIAGRVQDVRDLIKQDMRSFKRAPRDDEGKLMIQNKDEQKIILAGRSPDFGDNIIMRKAFDLRAKAKGVSY